MKIFASVIILTRFGINGYPNKFLKFPLQQTTLLHLLLLTLLQIISAAIIFLKKKQYGQTQTVRNKMHTFKLYLMRKSLHVIRQERSAEF